MKRGLVVRDRSEIADAEWDGRIDAVQSVMADQGLDFVLVYGDVFRSDDIGYLTNLCIYWNEGVVAVPAQGPPLFLTKLSQRVHSWMRLTSTMTDLRSGKTFGDLVTGLVAEGGTGTLGLVDADLWPASIVDEIREAIPGWDLRMLGSLVRDQRAIPSPAEIELLRTGAAILSNAVDTASAPGLSTTERIASLERDIRGGWLHRRGDPDRPHRRRTPLAPGERGVPARVAAREPTGGHRGSDAVAASAACGARRSHPLGAPRRGLGQLSPPRRSASSSAFPTTPSGNCGVSIRPTWPRTANCSSAAHHRRAPEVGEAVVLSLEVLHSGAARSVVAETILITADGAELLTIYKGSQRRA